MINRRLYVVESSIRHVVLAEDEFQAEDIARSNIANEGSQALVDVHALADDPLKLDIVNEWYGCIPYGEQGDNELTVEKLVDL